MRRRRLIVNADDLGLSDGVNRGIFECAEAGVVRSASMIVNMPGWSSALTRLQATSADLGIGLHFNIVAGYPLSSAPTITNPSTGRFYSLQQLAMRVLKGAVNRQDISVECAAQLAKLRDAGIPITHVDSHRHVHALPIVGTAVLDTAHAFGIRTIRTPLEPLRINAHRWDATLKKVVLATSWHFASMIRPRMRNPRHSVDPQHETRFFGVSLQGGNRFAERLSRLIERLPAGVSEIMVHPGYSDATLASLDSYTWQRECEVAALTSPSLRTRIRDNSIELVNFGSLRR